MRISASEFILFCNPPRENVARLSAYVPEVELMLDGDAWDYDVPGWPEQAAALQGCGVPFTVHPPAWDVNPTAPIRALRDAAAVLDLSAADFCAAVGGTQVVFHPGYYDGDSFFSKNRAKDFCYDLLGRMVEKCRPLGLTVAFENIAPPSMALFTQEEYVHALDGIDPCVKYLIDVGHAHFNHWDIPRAIDQTADRLCGFHLHDNNGDGDSHRPIGQGTIPWNDVFASMRQLPESVVYVMEYAAGTPLETLSAGRALLEENLG